MGNCIIKTYEGPLAVNYDNLKGVAKEVISGGTRGVRREKPGIAKVLAELQSCPPAVAEDLGIGADLLTRIATQTASITEVRAARVSVDKLAEILKETEASLEDDREGSIGLVVDSVRRASRQHPTALVVLEETVRYHGQVAARAAKTRVKLKKQALEAAEEEAAPPTDDAETKPQEAKPEPKEDEAAPKGGESAPKGGEAAPKGGEASPKSAEAAPAPKGHPAS